jgi:hypothetical protein
MIDPYDTANASFYRCVDGVGTREDATEMLRECWACLRAARDAKTEASRQSCYWAASRYMLVRMRAMKEIE